MPQQIPNVKIGNDSILDESRIEDLAKKERGRPFKKVISSLAEFESLIDNKECNFSGALFNCDIDYSSKELTQDMNFSDAYFVGILLLTDTKCDCEMLFRHTIFSTFINLAYKQSDPKKCSNMFAGASFRGEVHFSGGDFYKTHFDRAQFQDAAIFQNVTFNGEVSFEEVVFAGRFDARDSLFRDKANFSKTVFEGTTNLSATKFYGEYMVNFSSALFKKDFYAPRMTFTEGALFVDTIFYGSANLFKIKAKEGGVSFERSFFKSTIALNGSDIHTIGLLDATFAVGISLSNLIINKDGETSRLTFCILKHECLNKNNKIDALKYHECEMLAYKKDLKKEGSKKKQERTIENVNWERFIIWFNQWSNGFGLKPGKGLLLLLLSSVIIYILFLITLYFESNLYFDFSSKAIGETVEYWFKFLNLTNWNYKPFGVEYHWAYALLFLGRIILGLLTYQTIQAFRKYGRF